MIRDDSLWMGLRTQRVSLTSLTDSGSSQFTGEDSPHSMFLKIVHVVPAFVTTHFVAPHPVPTLTIERSWKFLSRLLC